jgi:hypothetical protein
LGVSTARLVFSKRQADGSGAAQHMAHHSAQPTRHATAGTVFSLFLVWQPFSDRVLFLADAHATATAGATHAAAAAPAASAAAAPVLAAAVGELRDDDSVDDDMRRIRQRAQEREAKGARN